MNRAQPVVDQTVLLMFKSRAHATASVMSTNDDVPDAQNIDRELQHRKTIQIVRQDQVADVAMNENLARWKIDNLIRRDPAVRTADPEILGRLLMCEAIEEIRIALVHPTRPSRVLIEEILARCELRTAGSHAIEVQFADISGNMLPRKAVVLTRGTLEPQRFSGVLTVYGLPTEVVAPCIAGEPGRQSAGSYEAYVGDYYVACDRDRVTITYARRF